MSTKYKPGSQGYAPVDLKSSNHRQIFDGLIDNIVRFQIIKNENISAGEIINQRPRITNFVIQNMNIAGWLENDRINN